MLQNQELNSVETLLDFFASRTRRIECIGLSGSQRAYLVARLYRQQRSCCLVIVPSVVDGQRLQGDLRFFMDGMNVPILFFPPYNILPYQFISYHSETAGHRIRVLYQLLESAIPPIVVTTVDALLQKIIPRKEISRYAELLCEGEEIERDNLIRKMISGGYSRTAIVEEPGDFSVRGGIIDIFCPLYPQPLRVEFFGDMVESLRFFSAASQRKIKSIEEAVILPAKEVIVHKAMLPDILRRIRARAAELDVPVSHARQLIDNIVEDEGFTGIESLMPLLYPGLETLFDYFPENALFVTVNSEELGKTAAETHQRIADNYDLSRKDKKLCVEPEQLYLEWSQAAAFIDGKKPLVFKMIAVSPSAGQPRAAFTFYPAVEDNATLSMDLKCFRDKDRLFRPLIDWLVDKQQAGGSILVVCRGRSQAQRLQSLLAPYDLAPVFINGFSELGTSQGALYICVGQVSGGFVWPDEMLAVLTDDEIFGVRHQRRKAAGSSPRTRLLELQELKKGDLIVHDDHGIGQYNDLVKLRIEGITGDFLDIGYKGGDKLYLPVDRMGIVQKYMGVDGVAPVLDTLGGKSWERVKARVKRSAERIAGELLKLYARRRVENGHAFTTVDSYMADFEGGFPYEETEDQLKAIEDVQQDMHKPIPMDRLVCGDVGYGKTEVALRASFLAVNEGKQVAVLVPTTILAEQHYATFCNRFERYPVNVACLSRFRAARVQRTIVEDLKLGKIDIVIGTHRLLQKDVAFHDLGLLVLDEEQRFGVKHKEKLKRLRSSVDVLALTATPIPRTLHLSLAGIRDISIISTPPEYRKSIVTYVCEFDEGVIREAVQKELKRGGQIFFVHNNIRSIHRIAGKLQQLVPEVQLSVAHGRMGEDELEQTMLAFMNREIDLLVCTTIIESGLDIAAANTIIVNRADRFGLAQIYQLRGRVGRAEEQAYAYLLIPPESMLGRDARKRLKVLMEHSDLGSGFQIAMSDLKIRGGGTLLGASQSGHIAAVGYDMFLKLMESAIADLKGEQTVKSLEPEINLNLSAHMAENYISDIDQRMAAYRHLARMTEPGQIADFKSELEDRYGPLPREAANLLFKIMLKVLARKSGIARLDVTEKKLILHFPEAHQHNPAALIEMIMAAPERFELTPEHVLKSRLDATTPNGRLSEIKNILKEIAQRVNR
jgi:transcription-repair coupling factor (superfamily II helicase)